MQTASVPTIGTSCSVLRGEIKAITAKVAQLKKDIAATTSLQNPVTASGPDASEMMANVTLSYRHLEDAAMRLGKVIQAWDGGTSVYDK